MPKYLLSYRSAKDYDALADSALNAAWDGFLDEQVAPSVVEPGWPVFEPATLVGETGPSTQLGGYSVVTADDIDNARDIAQRCPYVARGGGVEIGLLADLPAEHPAEQMRVRLAKA
jgi:YCII-related domain